jgi:hypothetical protein
MLLDMTNTPPRPIAAHVASYNDHNPDALMATFAPDALVNDAKREFFGRDAIRAWADKEIFADRITMSVQRVYDLHGDIILHAVIDAEFDENNLRTYYFSIRDDMITRLIIVPNKNIALAA